MESFFSFQNNKKNITRAKISLQTDGDRKLKNPMGKVVDHVKWGRIPDGGEDKFFSTRAFL